MKKVAIIAQTKEGQLSDASKQLISFLSSFKPESILLVSLGEVKFSSIAASSSVDVVHLSDGLWCDTATLQPLVSALDGYSVFGIKSIQVDNLLSLLASISSMNLFQVFSNYSGHQVLIPSINLFSQVRHPFP